MLFDTKIKNLLFYRQKSQIFKNQFNDCKNIKFKGLIKN